MKKVIAIAALLPLALFMSVAVACSSDDETEAEARQNYIEDTQEELSKIDERISDLETDMRDKSDPNLTNELASVKQERQELEEDLAQVRNSGDDNWRDAKEDVDNSLDDLDERIDTLVSDIAEELDPVAPGQGGGN